ncbi:hypothetical protein llg_34410 [Luteolibacter sp. LG18]|nr:hypothetical protein llg_34410 [Luteolibacter sp. LG18]
MPITNALSASAQIPDRASAADFRFWGGRDLTARRVGSFIRDVRYPVTFRSGCAKNLRRSGAVLVPTQNALRHFGMHRGKGMDAMGKEW